jgi:hypothetical protein
MTESTKRSQELESAHAIEPTRDDHVPAPGRTSRSGALVAPKAPIVSGLVMRKRDGNGVAEGAGDAVAAASSGSGASLPTGIMRKFEASLGADLSGVRVHTDGESAQAASAVGAKAYTVGKDIHFGAGHYDPSSTAGEHLLAHEVAHTVQQAGGVRYKLEVSAPGDAHEVEADRAADAMVAGSAFDVSSGPGVVARDPVDPNKASYANQSTGKANDPTQQGSGVDSEKESMKKEVKDALKTKKATAAAYAMALIGKASGLTPDKLTTIQTVNALTKAKYQPKIDAINAELKARHPGLFGGTRPAGQVGFDTVENGKVVTVRDEDKLKALRDQLEARTSWIASVRTAAELVGAASGVIGEVGKISAELNAKIHLIDESKFEKLDELKKVDKVVEGIKLACDVLDTAKVSQLHVGDFDSAARWGEGVGDIFAQLGNVLGNVFAEVPGGAVISKGLFNAPKAVITAFIDVIRSHYAHIDELVGNVGQGELLPDGGHGRPEQLPKE